LIKFLSSNQTQKICQTLCEAMHSAMEHKVSIIISEKITVAYQTTR